MKMKINLILLLLITLVCSCQSNEKPEGFDYGTVENNLYTNSFFNFKATLPDGWIVQSKKQTEDLVEIGKDMVAGEDENLKAVINASEINSAYLLTVFQYEVGAAVDYNPSLMLIAENLKIAPGIKNGSDYLFQTRKLFEQSQIKYNHIDDTFEKVKIGNRDFYRMNLDINHTGMNIKQSYYSTVINGFSFNAIISYVTDNQKQELEKTLSTFNFE